MRLFQLEAFDFEVKKKVNKLMRYTRYNWKPLDFKTREDAAAYTLARYVFNFWQRTIQTSVQRHLWNVVNFV